MLSAPETNPASLLERRLRELDSEMGQLRNHEQATLRLLRSKNILRRTKKMTKEKWVSIMKAAGFFGEAQTVSAVLAHSRKRDSFHPGMEPESGKSVRNADPSCWKGGDGFHRPRCLIPSPRRHHSPNRLSAAVSDPRLACHSR
jgi:hypothetical protein